MEGGVRRKEQKTSILGCGRRVSEGSNCSPVLGGGGKGHIQVEEGGASHRQPKGKKGFFGTVAIVDYEG